jgi:hypothetical protein
LHYQSILFHHLVSRDSAHKKKPLFDGFATVALDRLHGGLIWDQFNDVSLARAVLPLTHNDNDNGADIAMNISSKSHKMDVNDDATALALSASPWSKRQPIKH